MNRKARVLASCLRAYHKVKRGKEIKVKEDLTAKERSDEHVLKEEEDGQWLRRSSRNSIRRSRS